ncbi:TolC family protein [Marilutibacter chinensis]|uniref:TolC family protein n=1 Tax=Marilutibacter chinensis TaxID=2912247 RepID=A0ABS9HS92_9GAMM|nr:TolC family protein [Lysobacter chinensis]MCF7221543.1 TolC family protein [Lysobacter chinensis]
MFLRLAAIAAVVACAVAAGPSRAGERLSLDDAFVRVLNTHPDLRLADSRVAILAAERERAALRPPLTAGAELENAFGSGTAAGLEAADLTLSLGSVLERGGKPAARLALAERRLDALAVEREARRLDLLAETARRYLAVAAAEQRRAIAGFDIAQRRQAVDAARRRLQAGASPRSVLLSAQAALARAELEQARAAQQSGAARQHLAALWGVRDPQFTIDANGLQRLPRLADLDTIADWLQDAPELRRFADERRIREARLQLARSEAVTDIDWQIGARRLGDGDDVGLVAGISIPLGSRSRAAPAIRGAQAELAALEIEREAGDLSLYATLVDAHGRYRSARLEAARLDDEIVPALERAAAATATAYRAGAASYLEWNQAQVETIAARRQRLDAAVDALRALIEIQRLTGRTFLDDTPSEALPANPDASVAAGLTQGDAR